MKYGAHYCLLSALLVIGTAAAFAAPAADNKGESSKLSAKVLDPGRFYGLASMGYAAAQACPETIAKLFCYCGCDLTDNHSSLLDCFTSIHGVDCHICQEEAVLALKLHRDGVSDQEIMRQVDERYSSQYPFEQDTAAYKKYKATRAGKPLSSAQIKAEEAKAPPKTKSGQSFKPSCCSKDNHK
ncbi:MAG: PCYCGC domain-containing protein [Candidatus Obscuribacterales bacterium]|nr:PCYCGC domain-containing protein [Candidatus Obscuribacterales bacterium]